MLVVSELGQEILSLETNIDYIESMLLTEGEEEDSEGKDQAASPSNTYHSSTLDGSVAD